MEEEREAWVVHPHHHHHHHHGRHIGISRPSHADMDRPPHDNDNGEDDDDDTWTNPGAAPTTSVTTEKETSGHGASRKHGMQPQVIFGYYILRSSAEGWSGSSETMPGPDTNTTMGRAPRREDNMSRIRHARRRDYVTAEIRNEEVAFFGVFDDHGGDGEVGRRLASTLLDAILTQGGGLGSDPAGATRDAYLRTDRRILAELGPAGGGATAVTAMILHAGARLIVANVGDARAVLCKDSIAVQLSVDHVADRLVERANVEMRGGHIITFPGDLPRVDGMLSVTRVFGDANLKGHLSAKPDVSDILLDISCQFLVLGSNGLWVSFSNNQEVVDLIKDIYDPLAASKFLVMEARSRGSFDEISCIVIRFKEV